MAERFTLQPVITGSTWSNVVAAIWTRQPRGPSIASDETISPKMTNREALALIQAVRSAAPMAVSTTAGPREAWSLWYQFAAAAYGWDPNTDQLDTTVAQRDSIYDPDMGALLFQQIDDVAHELDARAGLDPRLELDAGAFDDPIMQSDVVRALRADGARAEVITGFRGGSSEKQSIPMCRDKKTGKARVPRVKCDPNDPERAKRNKRLVFEPNTRQNIEIDCDNEGDCELIDPLDGPRKLARFAMIALIVGGAIYLFAPAALSGVIAGRVARNRRHDRRRR